MKIYDCFMYWDEDLLLDLRMNIMNKYTDYFVIVEGNKTWQNNPKKFRFKIDKFKKFKNVSYESSIEKCVEKSKLIIIHTEWNEFKFLNFKYPLDWFS